MTTATITQRIARAIAPQAYEAMDRDPDSLTDAHRNDIRAADEVAADAAHLAAVAGFEEAGDSKKDLGGDMLRAKSLIDSAIALLEGHRKDAGGELDEFISDLGDIATELETQAEDIACDRCGEYNNDGEGFNGLCGNCADADESDERSKSHPRDNADHPTIGDKVGMPYDDEVDIEIADICLRQPNLKQNVWTIVDQYGEHHLVEDEGDRWDTVNPDVRSDVTHDDGEPVGTAFEALFVEDGVDDGDGSGMRCWRGILTKNGEQVRSTDLLHHTPQEACIAALDLEDDAQGDVKPLA